jgi:hypothetical protein
MDQNQLGRHKLFCHCHKAVEWPATTSNRQVQARKKQPFFPAKVVSVDSANLNFTL